MAGWWAPICMAFWTTTPCGRPCWPGPADEDPQAGGEDYAAFKDRQYDLLADLLEEHLNLDGLLEPAQ